MAMWQLGDQAHIRAMNEMQSLMKSPEAMNHWMENKRIIFEALEND
ncbi:hypothetical protein [Aquimarina intermedia]|uniref:Uncharacterized protein n=1 Tax=Aquimarina intermedia TaxID=350814 RepID=A0A5S5C443_9FLAO|nr:hypothetical protein [Aquimarina intermedia]TYP74191.1 hypothetical protein BD809_1046 [Aquimarina intermedia]